MMIGGCLCLISLLVCATCYKHQQAATVIEWSGPCLTNTLALNDCNWCKCNKDKKYSCNARVCNEVDVFGHFNDAIAEINLGMEGKGAWRSTPRACEPGVQYKRSDTLCVCTEDGKWPNPVCRDLFRILHPVKVTNEKDPKHQKCNPTQLYLIGCNVCFCPSTGKIDPDMCTKRTCTGQDDILEIKEYNDHDDSSEELAIYATCTPLKKYKLGCKTCECLKNNRLHCGQCNGDQSKPKNESSYCGRVEPGEVFNVDCNQCVCDKSGYAFCTVKKCIPVQRTFSRDPYKQRQKLSAVVGDEGPRVPCEPGQTIENLCRVCFCHISNDNQTSLHCTYYSHNDCYSRWNTQGAFTHSVPYRSKPMPSFEQTLKMLSSDCVPDTAYEVNCLVCRCSVNDKGEKVEVCEAHPKCENTELQDLNTLHGYCEPLHVYKKDCNVCRCLTDGKTVRCTASDCDGVPPAQEPITIDVVPVTQAGDPCPSGNSYKIDCNVCFCLSNGNAICTTVDCKKSHKT